MEHEDFVAQWCVEGLISGIGNDYLSRNRQVENPDFPFWMYDQEDNSNDAIG